MDFVHYQLATGRKLRILTIVDTFSRFSPALEPRLTFRGADVVEVLERVGRQVDFPATIRVDQGTEFVSRDLDLWAYQRGVTLNFSRPGKPTDNAFIKACNSRVRAECLNAHWSMSLADAQKKLEDWRTYYNEERPHGATGQQTPTARHRERAGKLYPLAIQSSGSLHLGLRRKRGVFGRIKRELTRRSAIEAVIGHMHPILFLVQRRFGRIAPSNAAIDSRHPIRKNPENETAGFQGFRQRRGSVWSALIALFRRHPLLCRSM